MKAPVHSWAVAGSVLAHGCAVALLLFRLQAAPSGAAVAGAGGLEASFGPMGGTPGAAVAPVEPAIEDAPIVEAADTAEAVPVETARLVEAPPVETAIDEAAEVPKAVPPKPPEAIEDIEAIEPVTPQEVEAIETVEAETEIPTVRMTEPEPPRRAEIPPPPVKPEPPRRVPEETPEPVTQTAALPPAPAKPREAAEADPAPTPTSAKAAGTGGRSGTEAATATGSGDDSAGGGQPGASLDYLARVSAWLEQYKEYPRRARLRGKEGIATLRFVIDRQGRVLSFELVRSSGNVLLDREVRDMIQRASPLPPMPEELRQARLELVVPVAFSLR